MVGAWFYFNFGQDFVKILSPFLQLLKYKGGEG
jgi:hypothetical protein